MSAIPEHFRIAFKPIAQEKAVIRREPVRFTLLTERLIRIEYQPGGQFEDCASQSFWYREQDVPKFDTRFTEKTVNIETDYFTLTYKEGASEGLSSENLAIHVKETDRTWYPDASDEENLLGTMRTLDFVNGYAPLEQGLMSRSGWAVVDDSRSLVFNEGYWLEPRKSGGVDLYFFAYGKDYKACLRDYCKVSGQMPLVPRWILGNWWSRYWAYTQNDFIELICDFEAHEIPLSICIIDMDWHITQTGNTSTGWTGYTWNRELIPDPDGLIRFMHDKGLHTALNLHPAEGIHPHEEPYMKMAAHLGLDADAQTPIEFDISDKAFVSAYFELLHHPNEAMGVDFWWIDWQQGQTTKIEGLDPLWLINHLHFHDLGRDGQKRPFIFSRWGKEGHQRYPIGFSGDSYTTWDSLRFQPYMTAAASNVAYGWWSHDIGGHTSGTGDKELFTRWVQFGVLSPIMRIHSGKGQFYDRRPWIFEDDEVLHVLREAMQFRHRLIPYLYTMAQRAHAESLPLALPMYYDYPDAEEAYHAPQQYLFGTELIAAPFVEPKDPDTSLSRQLVWLPEGEWVRFFTGEYYEGKRWQPIYGTLRDVPLFAKAGAIVPLGAWDRVTQPNTLEIHLFAGADREFSLYEDDGETQSYAEGQFCQTKMRQRFSGNRLVFEIDAPKGDLSQIPTEREISLVIHGIKENCEVTLAVGAKSVMAESNYDSQTETLTIATFPMNSTQPLVLTITKTESLLLARRDRKRETMMKLLKHMRLHVGVRNRIYEELDAILENPEGLAPYLIAMSHSQARALCEILFDAGADVIKDTQQPTLIVSWNNQNDAKIRYRYSDAYLYFGFINSNHHHRGTLPKFAALKPKPQTWTHGASEEHIQQTQWSIDVDYHNIHTHTESYREETP